jgi:hypothetical protein
MDNMMANTIRLTNGTYTFTVISDTPTHGNDKRGSGYARCETPTCDHEHAPAGAIVWHDDEHTEELWEA